MTNAPTLLTEGQALTSLLLSHHQLPFKKIRHPLKARSGLPLMLLAALLSTGAHAQTDAKGNTSIGIDTSVGQGGSAEGSANNTAIGYRTLRGTFGTDNTGAGASSMSIPNPNPLSELPSGNTSAGFETLLNSNNGNNNVALGSQSLLSNTLGDESIAIGFAALKTNSDLDRMVAIGFAALEKQSPRPGNIELKPDGQTGIGSGAMRYNTGTGLTATGYQALQGTELNFNNVMLDPESATTMTQKTANGYAALQSSLSGSADVAVGANALSRAQHPSSSVAIGAQTQFAFTGSSNGNTSVGFQTLFQGNPVGTYNTAFGHKALLSNGGDDNSSMGANALPKLISGNRNTAMGFQSLLNLTSGSNNIAVGYQAGKNLTTGSHNIYIGSTVGGSATESNTIRIGNAVDEAATNPTTRMFLAGIVGNTLGTQESMNVFINTGTGRLGVMPSSKRFKRDIKDMGLESEAIYSLRPVTYQYKAEFDPAGTPQIGLIAEEVEAINPDLVVYGRDHQIVTVRYEAVDAMLLNEVQKQQTMIQERQKELDALKAKFAAFADASAN